MADVDCNLPGAYWNIEDQNYQIDYKMYFPGNAFDCAQYPSHPHVNTKYAFRCFTLGMLAYDWPIDV